MLRRLSFALLSLHVAATVAAAESTVLEGSVATISGDGWKISGLTSELELSEAGLRGEFRMAHVDVFESGRSFDDVRVACAHVKLTTRTVDCDQATFTADIPGIGRQAMRGSFVYDRFAVSADITLSAVAVAGSSVRFDIKATEDGLKVRYRGQNLQLAGLVALASHFNDSFKEYAADGLSNISGNVAVAPDKPVQISLVADLTAAALSNDSGTIAADGVAAHLDLNLTLSDGNAIIDLGIETTQGEAYFEPAYANFSTNAVSLKAIKIVTPDFAAYEIDSFHLQQESLLDVEGSAALQFPADPAADIDLSANVELRNSSVNNLYTNLIKIQLAGTVLGDLETDGQLSGLVVINHNSLRSAMLELKDVILDDTRGRFAIYGLSGLLDWRADPLLTPNPSTLRWDSGTAYNITIGGGETRMQLGDNDIELLAPLRLATMGGALKLNKLKLHDYGSDDATGVLDAELEPIQLGQLTGAFGWPAFSGTLSGKLPLLQLAENTVTVGGTLSAQAFDGTIQMSDLRIEQPFGRVPRMHGELRFRNLDLRRLTETFSFGLIQGRLSGDILGLEMINWRPTSMDMHLYTPKDDKTPHRISQRAVENLASVGGGGAAGILSTGFLQFFEVFAYDQIGLRCVLRDAACAMSGAGPAKTGPQGSGYYIVKGRGIPRIDVVGFRNTVSWPRLVQQLGAITRSGSPTVN